MELPDQQINVANINTLADLQEHLTNDVFNGLSEIDVMPNIEIHERSMNIFVPQIVNPNTGERNGNPTEFRIWIRSGSMVMNDGHMEYVGVRAIVARLLRVTLERKFTAKRAENLQATTPELENFLVTAIQGLKVQNLRHITMRKNCLCYELDGPRGLLEIRIIINPFNFIFFIKLNGQTHKIDYRDNDGTVSPMDAFDLFQFIFDTFNSDRSIELAINTWKAEKLTAGQSPRTRLARVLVA